MIYDRPMTRIQPLTADAGPALLAAARVLLGEYRNYAAAVAGAGFGMAGMEYEIAELPASQLMPGGGLLIAWIDDQPAGCVAIRPLPVVLPERAIELKRLWVREAARGRGVAEALIAGVIAAAHAQGCTAIYLDTEPDRMPAAVRLYRRLGFVDCPLYKPSDEGVAAFRLALAGPDGGA
ncbi:MAG: Histone acetyltransferase [Rhodospirillales bacterium]|nr:Histone acetyltransferase [Rhodospirillales bacterium]